MKKQLFLLAGLLAMAVSCVSPKHNNNKEMNTEHLTYFSFDHHNAMAESGEKYTVSTLEDGRVHVVVGNGFYDKKEFDLDDNTIFEELLTIVKAYKMDKYKRDYQPLMDIYDGDSWSLYYKYDSGRNVSSGGYMAWPDKYHEMRKALSELFARWYSEKD